MSYNFFNEWIFSVWVIASIISTWGIMYNYIILKKFGKKVNKMGGGIFSVFTCITVGVVYRYSNVYWTLAYGAVVLVYFVMVYMLYISGMLVNQCFKWGSVLVIHIFILVYYLVFVNANSYYIEKIDSAIAQNISQDYVKAFNSTKGEQDYKYNNLDDMGLFRGYTGNSKANLIYKDDLEENCINVLMYSDVDYYPTPNGGSEIPGDEFRGNDEPCLYIPYMLKIYLSSENEIGYDLNCRIVNVAVTFEDTEKKITNYYDEVISKWDTINFNRLINPNAKENDMIKIAFSADTIQELKVVNTFNAAHIIPDISISQEYLIGSSVNIGASAKYKVIQDGNELRRNLLRTLKLIISGDSDIYNGASFSFQLTCILMIFMGIIDINLLTSDLFEKLKPID